MVIKKVLVVDDSATDLKNLEQICTGGGYDVITATSGVEAVAKASRENPDAVLLDVLMRDMNGFQVCRLLTSNESTQHIPIVLVSSKTQQTDRMWGEQQGAKAYITKPYTPDQILQQLRAFESASPTEPGR
ncbi:MAG: two-component system response regulator [Candidatus Muproteobacteria bacterium RBG_16_60_9]|uniref:Two-component system response regulator n=1 Tax=Candidatus Muproteobacteria bacterium RBG_16_60_9 TaxID=1817755 RepID=A0A1F6VJ49_9PROT|nr:MAG: two-component system response regulator [Candidatus Muproteobacteria bacterium RBG_16_60_9]